MGRGLLRRIEPDGTAAAGFCLGFGAVLLLSNGRTDEGGNTYAAAWFGFAIGHMSGAVEGRGR